MFLEHINKLLPGRMLGWRNDQELSRRLLEARGLARVEWNGWESYHGNPEVDSIQLEPGKAGRRGSLSGTYRRLDNRQAGRTK